MSTIQKYCLFVAKMHAQDKAWNYFGFILLVYCREKIIQNSQQRFILYQQLKRTGVRMKVVVQEA